MNSKTQTNQTKSKKGAKMLLKILAVFAVVIAVFLLSGTILHATYFKEKKEQIKPYGQLINVDDGQMHVFSMGNGEKTVVLLPGLGVALPSADFSPLMRKLSENYTVVCVEYFGIGFSSETSKPRTVENYVEETRAALTKAGFTPPFVLMPHSISGVYSEYYAAKYPEEVEAIIALDSTSTAYYDEMPDFVKALLPIAKIQQALGITSLLGPVSVDKQDLLSKGYFEKEINDSLVFAGFTMNDNIFEQLSNSAEFIKQTMDLPFPKSIPYFKIISKQTFETTNAQLKKANLTPQQYQYDHLARIGEQARFEVVDGSHFIYITQINRIVETTNDVLLGKN